MKIKAPRDFWAGLMFIAFGVGFGWVAQNYQMGTSVRMGPAYFPTMLGGLLALIGLAIFIQSFIATGPSVAKFYYRPLILIVVATVLFGILLKPLGLVLSVAVLVGIGAFGGFEFKAKEVAILYVVLAIFSVYVFVRGLGLPIPVWPGE
jgi:cellulose synthase/poly-beta-1,6-N-acetylglucosamine synthase-like glycosyltransferase